PTLLLPPTPSFFSFSHAPAPTEIYTLSLHVALPILCDLVRILLARGDIGARRGLKLRLLVVPKIPLAQNLFKSAVAHDTINRRVNLGLERFVAFAHADDVSAGV